MSPSYSNSVQIRFCVDVCLKKKWKACCIIAIRLFIEVISEASELLLKCYSQDFIGPPFLKMLTPMRCTVTDVNGWALFQGGMNYHCRIFWK